MDVRLQLSSVEVHEVCQSWVGSEGSGLEVKSQTVTVDHILLGLLSNSWSCSVGIAISQFKFIN